jgi:hypothetical protein
MYLLGLKTSFILANLHTYGAAKCASELCLPGFVFYQLDGAVSHQLAYD